MPSLEEKQLQTLIERLVNIKAEALVDDLIDKLAEKDFLRGKDTWRHSGLCGERGTG